jgi:hypothetical protein
MMKKVMFALVLAAAFNAAPSLAAADDAGCFEELANCMQRAATRDSWFSRWLAGMDCELDFVECTREKLMGG